MNDDYLQQTVLAPENEKMKKNKASFMTTKKAVNPDVNFDHTGLAFRKDAQKALNKDNIVFRKIDLNNYIEKLRTEANKEIFEFFADIDPNTDSKNLKLLYFYFVGSRNLLNEMTSEAVNIY